MNFKKHILAYALPIAVLVSSCEKLEDFGDTNVNPGGATTPVVGALLTNVESQLGGYAANTRAGLYGQYFSETQYTDASLYSIPQIAFNGEYAGVLEDLQNIINTNTSNNQNQVARILQQYIYWTITDRWGDVPYSEALAGNVTPKFDAQEAIYKGMISTLTDAVSKFDDGAVITGDIIYSGNADSWKKFANSLRMMMALQLSKRYPGASDYAATEFKAALADAGGYIDDASENMVINYPGGNFKNPWFNTYNGRKDLGESKTMTDLLGTLGDARQQVFGGKSEDPANPGYDEASTVGMPYGLARARAEAFTSANPEWARILRGDYRLETSPLIIMSAAQVSLARAEAADYGWTSESVAQLYNLGITQSHQDWDLAAPTAAYLAQAAVAPTAAAGTGANLQKIATQRYIASYPDGMMAWNIWRKTGYPQLTPAPDATNATKQIPRRYTYGQAEFSTNGAATQEAIARMGGDTQDTRVWWDVQ